MMSFRLDPHYKLKLYERAASCGMPPSMYVRQLVIEQLEETRLANISERLDELFDLLGVFYDEFRRRAR